MKFFIYLSLLISPLIFAADDSSYDPTSMEGYRKSVRRELLKVAQPLAYEARKHGMSKVAEPDEPKHIQQQRKLIEGKKLQMTGELLFKSYGLDGKLICALTNSPWSHAGKRLTDQDGQEYCFESTGSVGQIFEGMLPQVQIHKLEYVVRDYAGDVAVRPISYKEGKEPNVDAVTELVVSWIGVPYERRPLELVKSIGQWNKQYGESQQKALFCSEMCALMNQKLGYLPKDKPASNYIPRHFGEQDFNLIGGAHLEDIINLKRYQPAKNGCCVLM